MRDGDVGVVVLAAGRGLRMGSDTPKAYLSLGGKPILQYSLETFDASPRVGEIVLVVHPDDQAILQERVLDAYEPAAQLKVVYGGEHRQDSTQAGVRAVRSPWVAVHDAARPFASDALFVRVIETAETYRAALPSVPIAETVKTIDDASFALGDVEREALQLAQTPQCFEQLLLDRSLDDAERDRRYFTDEAGVVLATSGIKSRVVPGEATNIKITTPQDLALAEALLDAGLIPGIA